MFTLHRLPSPSAYIPTAVTNALLTGGHWHAMQHTACNPLDCSTEQGVVPLCVTQREPLILEAFIPMLSELNIRPGSLSHSFLFNCLLCFAQSCVWIHDRYTSKVPCKLLYRPLTLPAFPPQRCLAFPPLSWDYGLVMKVFLLEFWVRAKIWENPTLPHSGLESTVWDWWKERRQIEAAAPAGRATKAGLSFARQPFYSLYL